MVPPHDTADSKTIRWVTRSQRHAFDRIVGNAALPPMCKVWFARLIAWPLDARGAGAWRYDLSEWLLEFWRISYGLDAT